MKRNFFLNAITLTETLTFSDLNRFHPAAMAYQPKLSQDQFSSGQEMQTLGDQYQQPPPYPLSSQMAPSVATKTYNMYYTTSRLNVKLHLGASSAPCTYYGEFSYLTNKPQIQLRSGNSKSAPMVAFAKVHYTSRNLLIGLGDYQKDPGEKLILEEMRRDKFRLVRSDYEFETSVGSGPRRTYGWRRDKESLYKTVYRCVDDAGEVIVSLFSGGFCNWKKGGEIVIVDGLDKELEEFLLASTLAIWAAEAGWSVHKGYGNGGDSKKIN